MAATIMSPPAIDFKSTATYTVRLGDSLAAKDSLSSHLTALKYNHKPKLRKPRQARCTIHGKGKQRNQAQTTLNIEDGSDVFEFKGERAESEDTYVLILNEDKEFVLEKLSTHHVYNLTRAPGHAAESELLARYPQLNIDDEGSGEDDLGGNEDGGDSPIDPKNPFDFRNLLKKGKSAKPKADIPRSVTSTPNLTPSSSQPVSTSKPSGSTPTARPTKATSIFSATVKRKAAAKPVAATTSAPSQSQKRTKTEQSQPALETSVPRVHLQRKASVHPGSDSIADDDDSGELILENMETPVTSKPSAMTLALTGQLGSGPISLRRSAANSPAGALGSSSVQESQSQQSVHIPGEDEAEEEEESDADEEDEADGDVEALTLDRQRSEERVIEPGEEFVIGDEEDELSKELEAAFEVDGGGEEDPAIRDLAASDEESEEE